MRREGDEPFQIGLFHCNAGGDPQHDPYAPRSISELEAAKLDYWALGHIHERKTLRATEPFIGYPGNTQGRHINESGPRGCLLVNVAANGKLLEPPEFIATDRVRWESCNVDIAGMETIDDLMDAVEDRMDGLEQQSDGRAVVTRITIQGRGALHRELGRTATLATLQEQARSLGAQRTPFIWIERLSLKTRPDLDLSSRRNGQDFLADLLRLFDEVRGSPDELQALGEALSDLYHHRNGRKFLSAPDERLVRELLDEAEIRAADLLAEED